MVVLASGIDVISQRVQVLRPDQEVDPGKAGPFNFPMSMVTDQAGNIYVLDNNNHRVVVFSSELKFLRQIGVVGQGPGELLNPTAMAISRSGEVIVADGGNRRVQRYDLFGHPLGSFSIKQPMPPTLVVNSRDEIFMSEPAITGKLVSVYDKNGRLLRTFGELRPPKEYGIQQQMLTQRVNEAVFALDADENLLIAFRVLPAFRKYDQKDRLVFETELRGSEVAKLLEERGQPDKMPRMVGRSYRRTMLVSAVAVDQKGRIWIQLSGPPTNYVYNREGKYITKFETEIQGEKIGFSHIFIHRDLMLGTSSTYGCWLLKLPAL
jgi:hypothetical protein